VRQEAPAVSLRGEFFGTLESRFWKNASNRFLSA
jgi:hypothetical protein